MTPNDIEVLLHCYTSPVRHPRFDAPAVRSTHKDFEELGLLQRNDEDLYIVTNLGKAYIKTLLDTPCPRTGYIDKDGNVINIDGI